MKVLSIGNSFSEDAQRYLHGIAMADGFDLYCVNLCIGGCPLSYHAENIRTGEQRYVFQENGVITERLMSLREGLSLEEWDVVTIQQVSINSFKEETYYPHIIELADFIRRLAPKAKLLIQQTWAYEQDSERIIEVWGNGNASEMLCAIKKAYTRAKNEINADGIIPSGELFAKMIENGVSKIHRDTFHASWGLGRYALGLLWYRSLTGRDVLENAYSDFDEPVEASEIAIAKACADKFEKVI